MTLTEKKFENWLGDYGKAWEAMDAAAFGELFEEDAIYYWTPFGEPKRGREEISAAIDKAVKNQKDVDFGYRILYVQSQLGCAHWSCALTRKATGERVHIDGILVVQFKEGGKALSFREWWHTDEGR
jgi:ketosteroid isomerase-like protein